jgi:DNA-binding cell septation regulator SpoVG
MDEKDYKQIPVYRDIDDLGDIRGLGRQDEKVIKFHENNSANAAVIEWMNANRQNYFPDANHFHAERMIKDMAETFGLDRSMHVLLHNVSEYDGRFADDVKHRSRTERYIMKPSERREGNSRQADSAEFNYCHTDMHPVYLDSVIKYGMELERAQLRENLPKFGLGSKFTDEYGTELIVIGKKVGEPQKAGWYDNDPLAARLGEKPDITLVVGMENGRTVGDMTFISGKSYQELSTWIFTMKPYLQLNPDNTVSIGDYSHEMVADYAFDPEKDDYIKDWEFSAKDFEIGFTYLNHNGFSYTVLDKGMTYYDEPFIKVQTATGNPDQAWTAWCVKPEILKDGTLEWAYSKDRDLTIDPEKNINLEEQEMNETLSVTAHMTYLADVQQQDPKSNFVGLASISVAETYVISGIQVYQSTNDKYSNPYYASMPDMKGSDNDYHPVVFATAEAREAMSKAVSGAFIAAKEQGKNIDNHYPSYSSALAPKQNAQEISAVIKGDTYQRDFKANANITLYGQFEVKGVKLMTSKDGNDLISMPSQKGKDGEYHDLVFPITAEARDSIFAEINAKLADRAKIIGNVKYSDIQDKAYLVISANDIKGVAEVLENSGIGYSGKPHESGAYTITVERADIQTVEVITKNIHGNEKPDRTDIENFAKTAEQTLEQTRENTAERGQ